MTPLELSTETGKVVKADSKTVFIDHMGAVVPVKIDSTTKFEGTSLTKAKDLKEGQDIRASFSIKNQTDTNVRAVAMLRESVAKAKPDDWQTYYRAGNYLTQNRLYLDDAGAWLDKAIAISPN